MIRLPRIPLFVLLFAASLSAHDAGPTGQDSCYDGAALAACVPANSGDTAAKPRQDGRFGHDAAAGVGTLTKTGADAKGFDYTKVCLNGDAAGSGACTGALVANIGAAATGTPSTDWACTRDNVTNLIWSLESGIGNWMTYAQTTLPAVTNAASRCGYSTGWRLPTRRELLFITYSGAWLPAIGSAYFPATQSGWYWSADTYAPVPVGAWVVHFHGGGASAGNKAYSGYVRLARSSGQ